MYSGFSSSLRLLPLLPFVDAIRRNLLDVINLSNAGLSNGEIFLAVPDFGLSSIVLAIGLSMYFLRWRTRSAGGLLLAGVMLQLTWEIKEYHKEEYTFWDFLTLLMLEISSTVIAISVLKNKSSKDIGFFHWVFYAIALSMILLFLGHEEHYYMAWHFPLYLTLLSFAHLASVPQWIAYDSGTKTISINSRRQRGRVLLLCLSLLLIPSILLFFRSKASLPEEISFYRVVPLFILPVGALNYNYMPIACMFGFIGWTADLLNRILHSTASWQLTSENIAVISSFLIALDYSIQAEALLPS